MLACVQPLQLQLEKKKEDSLISQQSQGSRKFALAHTCHSFACAPMWSVVLVRLVLLDTVSSV